MSGYLHTAPTDEWAVARELAQPAQVVITRPVFGPHWREAVDAETRPEPGGQPPPRPPAADRAAGPITPDAPNLRQLRVRVARWQGYT
jgi:hypothetical protein